MYVVPVAFVVVTPLFYYILAFFVGYAMADYAYNSFTDVAQSIIDAMPTVQIVLCVIIGIVSVILAIKKKQILHGIVMFLSWSKCVLFMGMGFEGLLEGIIAAKGVLMSIFVVPFLFIVCIGIPGVDLYFTTMAWLSEDKEERLKSALIETAVVAVIIFVLWLIS